MNTTTAVSLDTSVSPKPLEVRMSFQSKAASEPFASPSYEETWTLAEIVALFNLPFNDLMFKAQGVHRSKQQPWRPKKMGPADFAWGRHGESSTTEMWKKWLH